MTRLYKYHSYGISYKKIGGQSKFRASLFAIFFVMLFTTSNINAQGVSSLKKLSMEDLMNIEVTLVTRQPEKLSDVASAIQVLTNEDIRRSSSARLPEALKLLPNLQVSKVNSYATIVSARGFNNIFANKMLVMIDGRSVYSPLFAGVFWDVQNVLLEDIERVEAISGPGGTLWGMNAVNGVINIITKSAEETQGLYVSGSYGSYLKNSGAIRYGGKLGDKFYYRVFGQRFDYGPSFLNGVENNDNWNLIQGGFRIDGNPSEKDEVMIQGNIYGGKIFTDHKKSTMDGENTLARWTHTISEKSNYSVQVYFDRTWRRDIPSTISDQMTTFDFDFQHNFSIGKSHSILWGVGYRFVKNKALNSSDFVGFIPNDLNMPLYGSFIQDEIKVIGDKLKVTIGAKFQHNVFSDFEIQPSGRIAFVPSKEHTWWGAISRAIRAPSRIDVNYHIPAYEVPPGTPSVDGGPNFEAEKLLAYELGYRLQLEGLSLSAATFYNQYDDLYSVEAVPHDPVRYQIMNGSEGYSTGFEFSGVQRVSKSWKVRTGYTYFHKRLSSKPGHVFDTKILGHDPAHQFIVQSMLDLPGNLQLDFFTRYIGELETNATPEYLVLDGRLAWMFRNFEISFNCRNILKDRHQEFGEVEIPRNYYGNIIWRL